MASSTMDKLRRTVGTAMRMLDNVVDINFYAVDKARNSNVRHRPVGLGIMGFQECLHMLRIPYASQAAVEFADRSMEAVCYNAYWASSELAEERGRYSSFKGSLWDRGILPLDSLDLLADERGGYLEVDRSSTLDWDALRTPASGRLACATPIAWPLRRQPPFPTSSASRPASSRSTRTSTSNPTCPASSPLPMNTWCATSRRWACGTR
jgi:hypothetical protein